MVGRDSCCESEGVSSGECWGDACVSWESGKAFGLARTDAFNLGACILGIGAFFLCARVVVGMSVCAIRTGSM